MSGSSRVDLAALASSAVLTIDQLMKALEASHEHKSRRAKKYLGYAALGALIAAGSLELLRRDEEEHHHPQYRSRSRSISTSPTSSTEDLVIYEGRDRDRDYHDHQYSHHEHHDHHHGVRGYLDDVEESLVRGVKDSEPNGHTRRLAEEILGVYSLGQEIMGHKKNHGAHIIAEILGAVAALKNTRDHVQGVE